MSVNKVILVGNVGKDPDVRYFDNEQAVANFPLATTERGYKTRDGQDIPERTEWHNIVAWRGLAKIAESYIKKGTQIYVEGKLKTRSYDDQNGVKKYITEIYADTIQLLGRKPGSEGQPSTNHESQNIQDTQASKPPVFEQPSTGQDNFLVGNNTVEDDLPF
jgi:single-strand DNA-binding protein